MGRDKVTAIESRARRRRRKLRHVHQFLIVLTGTDPLVWRRIQVPEAYSFWDLHVAIQDAMGWQDCHLHEFTVMHPERKHIEQIGIPDEDFPEERPTLPGWKVRVANYFPWGSTPGRYLYDFGDDWEHVLVYEGTWPAEDSGRYPRCVAGAAACPPEDCGGITGYGEFLEAIRDPRHPEHERMIKWCGGAFDPHAFDLRQMSFDDPKMRWKLAFAEA